MYTYLGLPTSTGRAVVDASPRRCHRRSDVDEHLVPSYYASSGMEGHHLWVKLSDFEQLPASWAQGLVRRSVNPGSRGGASL